MGSCLALAAIGLHLASYHTDRPSNPEYGPSYNNANPGLYVQTKCGLTVGGYYNSIGRFTAHAGYTYDAPTLPVFVSFGIATGYNYKIPVVPMAMAGFYVNRGDYRMRIGWIPKLGTANDTHVLHLMAESRF